RIRSATNADLGEEVTAGRFRQDLLFRLNTIEVRVPSLRDRRKDIPTLASLFLRQHVRRYRKKVTGFDPAALQLLLDHSWPGNVRELDHAVERGVLMAQGDLVRAAGLAGSLVALILLWTGDFTLKVQWTLTTFLGLWWLGYAFHLRNRVVMPLQTLSNLQAALREGDFSIRARGARRGDALGDVMIE